MKKILISIQEAINLLPDAVLLVDKDTKIITTNELALQLFGYTPKELYGKKLKKLLPKREWAEHIRNAKYYFQNPQLRQMGEGYTRQIVRKDGEEIDVDVALAPVKINSQEMVIISLRDISQFKELERNLIHRNEQLSVINTELERFGYIIAHDLKSPLLNLHAIVSLLKREMPEEQSQNLRLYMDALDQTLRAMMNLISGVSEYSKASFADRPDEKVDLNEVIKEVRSLIHLPSHITIHVSRKLPVLQGDKTKILQVFLNLINNAIKYNDKPEGKIVVKCRKNAKDFRITISDNGPGVPLQMRRKIFGLFKQGHIQKEGSQGIGLAVVKKIISDRGGKISVQDNKMGGADFIFTWPNEMKVQSLEDFKAARLIEERKEAA